MCRAPSVACRSVSRLTRIGALVALIACAVRPLAAQQLRGTVLFSDSTTPARATLIHALDSTGAVVARTLTTPLGAFALTVPGEGRYMVRVLRIGYRPFDVRGVRATLAAAPPLTILLRSASITLPAIAVRGERTCRARADSSQAVYGVWEEARKALQSAEAAGAAGNLVTEWFTYRRQVLADSGSIYEEIVDEGRGRTPKPFISVAPESLALDGYRRMRGGLARYLGPDAAVLLSDVFLGGHCFRLNPPAAAHPGWVGVEFEPASERRNVIEITGTAWLERATAELKLVEFRYTNLPRDVTEAGARGRIELTRLPTGEFVINRWYITMAGVQEMRRDLREFGLVHSESRRVITHANLSGGELRGARVAGLEQYALAPNLVTLTLVADSGAVSTAFASLSVVGEAGVSALTDSAGVARVVGLGEGEHRVRIVTPAMREMVARPIERRFTIGPDAPGRTATITVSERDLVAAVCGAEVARRGNALVTGVLRDPDGDIAQNDTLEVRWTRAPKQGEMLTTEPREWNGKRVGTDEYGRWMVCDVPRPSMLALLRVTDDPMAEMARVRLSRERQLVRLEVTARK